MVDIHSHILPGLDDGPSNFDFSLAMARAAVESGTQIVVATPHIRSDFAVDIGEIAGLVDELNDRLEADRMPLRILPGGEIGWSYLPSLDDADLAKLRLGSSDYLLVETPHGQRSADFEGAIEELNERGYKAVLAHPERCPLFQRDPGRLEAIVAEGSLCSVTAGSMVGRFGERVRQFTMELFVRGLVHDVASDSHDHLNRPPGLQQAFTAAEAGLPGIAEHRPWFTTTAPVAILSGRPLPPVPQIDSRGNGRWRRLFARSKS